MPLGDSITHGYPTDSGYRNYLWYALQEDDYDIDFIGSLNDGLYVNPAFDINHEGYDGWKTYDIANVVYGLLIANEPDVILLHIGSNDASPTQGLDSSSVSGLTSILNQIDLYESNYNHPITVVLATIINRRTYHATITNFNINLKNMAQTRISNGDKIVLVDMAAESALSVNDYIDATHPNNIGYEKMSTVWFDTLKSILPKDNYAYLIATNYIILN
jgi:lysophospholipase L1-like esterase